MNQLEGLDPKKYITIKGARVHNLKNVDIVLPRNKLIVITGVSGSGKSSLAFDTLYAEGQRRYVESLSAYARQFLGKIGKPDVDYINGISPAIAIEQKVSIRTSRSTVGTSSEIYDYLKLLFARIGRTYSPVSGELVRRHTVADVVDYILTFNPGAEVCIMTPMLVRQGRTFTGQLQLLLQQGFSKLYYKEQILRIEDIIDRKVKSISPEKVRLLIDRFVLPEGELVAEFTSRISDSVQTAFYEGNDDCEVEIIQSGKKQRKTFSDKFEADGIKFEEPTPHFFSFNNPIGACKRCEGFGSVIDIDEDLVVPDKSLSVFEDAVACWKGEKMSLWKERVIRGAAKCGFPIHRAYSDLNMEEKNMLWNGTDYFNGIHSFFTYIEGESYRIQYRVMLSRFRGKTICPECKGTRLRKDANYIKVHGKSLTDLLLMPLTDSYNFFKSLSAYLNKNENDIARRLLIEITNRLGYLNDVGLGYLTLNRSSNTISGGESQRLNLANSIGSSLVGSLYILDEPSIGLHCRDTKMLIQVLKSLRNLGNTVIVVEHDEEIMRAADAIVDIGPLAGVNGGKIIFNGTPAEMIGEREGLTARYLNGLDEVPIPVNRIKLRDFLEVKKAAANNLKGIDVKFPLGALTVVSGVSGSGKSSLVKGIVYPGIKRLLGQFTSDKAGHYHKISGNTEKIKQVEFVDQTPIGKSSRSNPVTYIKAFDEIRTLFAEQPLAKLRGYKPSYFSFNVTGGRCDVCEGDGEITIEMQFMADLHITCEVCEGKRYKSDTLEVTFNGKSINDVLNLTIDESIDFFVSESSHLCKRIASQLKPLKDVGMGYIRLGQSSSTLSGGEAQRTKLASFLTKGVLEGSTLFIFDEPTTGLHFHDVSMLLSAFKLLTNLGHTLLVIEHHPDIIKCADWVIDLGPEAGDKGGNLVFQGTPMDLLNCKESFTADCIRDKMKQQKIAK